ncbi:MAG: 30S ribosomal protein S9 [Saprospiraceae bacterium]|nr:MAG: 30S ribosomal protein S9 [Saprospiraceae bacterium]
METINTIGRRKEAVARVYLRKGSGKILVNGKDYKEYFPQIHIQAAITDPFRATQTDTAEFDLTINVDGGGFKGQAEAIRMGIARALVALNPDLRKPLKDKKYLTRDSRQVERKKYGKPKARKSFQFSKR